MNSGKKEHAEMKIDLRKASGVAKVVLSKGIDDYHISV